MKHKKLCVALDVASFEEAIKLVDKLSACVDIFKVGSELFTRTGTHIIDAIHEKNKKIFLDLKFHDIPNTVRGACRAAAAKNVALVNVHAVGGFEMMRAAAQGVLDVGSDTRIIAVTVLTSINEDILINDVCIQTPLQEYVKHLSLMAEQAGLHGVVASPQEIGLIRQNCSADFLIVTPGVRPVWAMANDQKRTLTPKEAMQQGANYIVVGRPITRAGDPLLAASKILEEIG